MTLTYILLATLVGGLLSVAASALLSEALLGRMVKHLVSLSAGVLLGAALLHVLPEAFESQAGAQELFLTLLAGLLFFFLLEKVELYRHSHHHEGDGHHHHHHFDAEIPPEAEMHPDAVRRHGEIIDRQLRILYAGSKQRGRLGPTTATAPTAA